MRRSLKIVLPVSLLLLFVAARPVHATDSPQKPLPVPAPMPRSGFVFVVSANLGAVQLTVPAVVPAAGEILHNATPNVSEVITIPPDAPLRRPAHSRVGKRVVSVMHLIAHALPRITPNGNLLRTPNSRYYWRQPSWYLMLVGVILVGIGLPFLLGSPETSVVPTLFAMVVLGAILLLLGGYMAYERRTRQFISK